MAARMMAPLLRSTDDAATRAGLVASQVLGLALTRYVLRLPPVVAMDRDTVIGWIGPTLQRYFTGTRTGDR